MNWLWFSLSLMLMLSALAGEAMELPKRPFVFMNESELAALRAQLSEPGWKADLYRAERGNESADTGMGFRSNADRWIHRKIDIPTRGGHFHNFFCTDGNRLIVPDDQRYEPGPYRCPKCGKEYSGARYEDALRREVHVWMAQACRDLAMVGALEHRPEYSAKAAEILLKYADAYPGPHINNTTGGMIYQSLDESMWVIPLAQAYDLIYNDLTDAQRQKIEGFLRTVAQGIQRCGTAGNWGSWHLSAVGVVAYAIGDEALVNWATKEFQRQIRNELGDDGIWPESIHTYHFFPQKAFMSFAEAAWHAGVDLYHWEGKPGKMLLSMFHAPLEYAYPDFRLPAINDGWFEAFLPVDYYELAYYRTRDPRFAWVLANGYRKAMTPAGSASTGDLSIPRGGLYAFLFGGEIPKQVTPLPSISVNYPGLGIGVLRSPNNNAVMTFQYGPFRGHGQPSKMSITLYANGKLWAADYGTPGYGSSILPWYTSTLSHNTVVVDGKNQRPTKESTAELWLGDSLIEGVRSVTNEAYPGISHSRMVLRVGEDFVIVDKLRSDTEHTYDFYLHSEGHLALDQAASEEYPVEPAAPWIENPTAREPHETFSGRWAIVIRGLSFWMTGENPITPIVGECPAESGSRKVPLLIGRQTGKSAEFITVLSAYREKPDLRVVRDGEKLIIGHHEGETVVTLPREGERPTAQRR